MDLWIRSQDRQTLKKINTEIYLKSGLSDYALGDVYFLVSGGTNLGEYKTKERALEVLDEIHNIIKPKGILKFDMMLSNKEMNQIKKDFNNEYMIFDRNVEIVQEPATYVYQMPEE